MSANAPEDLFVGKILSEGLHISRGPLYRWSKEHFGPDFETEYRKLAETYLQILRDRGAAELEAIYSCLQRIKSHEKEEHEENMSSVRRMEAYLDKDPEEQDEDVVSSYRMLLAAAPELKAEFERRESAINLRLTIIQRILVPYAESGVIRPLGELLEEINIGGIFSGKNVYHLLKSALDGQDLITEKEFANQWVWHGTQEQLAYLIFRLKETSLITPHNYWKRASELFSDENGSSFSFKQLRSVSGNLEYSKGGYPSTRGDEIDSVIKSILERIDGSNHQG